MTRSAMQCPRSSLGVPNRRRRKSHRGRDIPSIPRRSPPGNFQPQAHLEGLRRRRALLDPAAAAARRARPGHGGHPAMSGRSFLLDVAGGRRRIRVFEAGDGPPLVFLHGADGLVEESPFLAALGRRWHVFAPLLPGYGDSEGGDTLPDMLAITFHSFDVIEALGLARPHLVGHSMGGMIAAEMPAVAPHDVERLGLIAPAGLWLDDHPIPDFFSKLPHGLPGLFFPDPGPG